MTTDYPRCATCKHWRRTWPDEPDADPVEGWGWCDAVQLGLHTAFAAPIFVYPVEKMTRVATASDFGCVLHEPKEHIP